jgi:hypothetical protein
MGADDHDLLRRHLGQSIAGRVGLQRAPIRLAVGVGELLRHLGGRGIRVLSARHDR